MENWEQLSRLAYELFDKQGNRPIVIEELASVIPETLKIPSFHLLWLTGSRDCLVCGKMKPLHLGSCVLDVLRFSVMFLLTKNLVIPKDKFKSFL